MESPELFLPILLGIPLLWGGIFAAVAQWGGWSRLARQFPADRMPEGTVLKGQSMGMSGWASYGGCTTFIDSDEGLYVSLPFPFGIFHPPLLIPWSELRNPVPRAVLWQRFLVVQAGDPPVRMELPAGKFEHRFSALREQLGTISARSASGTVPESQDEGKISNRR